MVRQFGPHLVDRHLDSGPLVLDELGVRFVVDRLVQKLEWDPPLPAGEESGWDASVDSTGAGEPTPEEDAETKRLQDEAWREAVLAG